MTIDKKVRRAKRRGLVILASFIAATCLAGTIKNKVENRPKVQLYEQLESYKEWSKVYESFGLEYDSTKSNPMRDLKIKEMELYLLGREK